MDTVETRFGTITHAASDFGYGNVTLESDGRIAYRDSYIWKEWKTVRGFERWADKQNVICCGVYDRIQTREYHPRKTVLSWC